jgi:hypothetical protein
VVTVINPAAAANKWPPRRTPAAPVAIVFGPCIMQIMYFSCCRDGLLGLLDLNRMRNCVLFKLMLLAAVCASFATFFADKKF